MWSVTMTRWLIARSKAKTAWKLVTFTGRRGGESVGIVDILAVRKDHGPAADGLKRGDAFEIILIQVKGGSAPWPSWDDVQRLDKVGRRYAAKAVLLAEWKKGRQPVLYRLEIGHHADAKSVWHKLDRPSELFR